jgi:hypothetical protein
MAWIQPFECNMDFSRRVYEDSPDHPLLALAQKIAIYAVIPMMLIVFFEAVVKNLIVIKFANMGIAIVNAAHRRWGQPA